MSVDFVAFPLKYYTLFFLKCGKYQNWSTSIVCLLFSLPSNWNLLHVPKILNYEHMSADYLPLCSNTILNTPRVVVYIKVQQGPRWVCFSAFKRAYGVAMFVCLSSSNKNKPTARLCSKTNLWAFRGWLKTVAVLFSVQMTQMYLIPYESWLASKKLATRVTFSSASAFWGYIRLKHLSEYRHKIYVQRLFFSLCSKSLNTLYASWILTLFKTSWTDADVPFCLCVSAPRG